MARISQQRARARNEPATIASKKSPTRPQITKLPAKNPNYSSNRTELPTLRQRTVFDDESDRPVELEEPVVSSSNNQATSRQAKRITDNSDYCMIFNEPVAKKPKTEATANNVETYSFDHPSASILKQMCEKLKIEYDHEAYIFGGKIIFNKFVSSTDIIQSHGIKSSNIFACLSLFFTGKIRKCHLIEDTVKSAFCDEVIAAGTMAHAEIDQIFINSTVTPEQIEFIAKFLACRIGIYENGKLKKYGNWEDENVALTLILSFVDKKYAVVFDL
uniref:Uncharacterized protein n=1 Tax=Panagrolaimus sp. ES5 TaxID=591445 RepID=A0AC34G4Z1_9BILA